MIHSNQWLNPGDPDSCPSLVGECLDDFQLQREIVRGGMGVVYEAIQKSLRRRVAVKLISDGVLANVELRSHLCAPARHHPSGPEAG